jgi:hypothetical protein
MIPENPQNPERKKWNNLGNFKIDIITNENEMPKEKTHFELNDVPVKDYLTGEEVTFRVPINPDEQVDLLAEANPILVFDTQKTEGIEKIVRMAQGPTVMSRLLHGGVQGRTFIDLSSPKDSFQFYLSTSHYGHPYLVLDMVERKESGLLAPATLGLVVTYDHEKEATIIPLVPHSGDRERASEHYHP